LFSPDSASNVKLDNVRSKFKIPKLKKADTILSTQVTKRKSLSNDGPPAVRSLQVSQLEDIELNELITKHQSAEMSSRSGQGSSMLPPNRVSTPLALSQSLGLGTKGVDPKLSRVTDAGPRPKIKGTNKCKGIVVADVPLATSSSSVLTARSGVQRKAVATLRAASPRMTDYAQPKALRPQDAVLDRSSGQPLISGDFVFPAALLRHTRRPVNPLPELNVSEIGSPSGGPSLVNRQEPVSPSSRSEGLEMSFAASSGLHYVPTPSDSPCRGPIQPRLDAEGDSSWIPADQEVLVRTPSSHNASTHSESGRLFAQKTEARRLEAIEG
jgi:hypothetical protein